MTPLDTIGPYEELGLHPERTDPQEMILSRMDTEALTRLAEEGNLEDVQAIVLSLVGDNPQMEKYLADFQQTNDTAFVTELREAAAEEVGIVPDTPEASETEEMTPEEMIQHAKEFLYSSLDISEDEASNGALTNFAKGIVDTLIIGNAELALQVIETKGQVILEALKNLASWSGIKQVLSALGESIWDLFTGSAYEKGKAVADLGLVATGLGAGISVGRKVLKTAVKSLDVPSAKNLDSLLLDDVAKLPPAERLEAAGVFLGRKEMSQAEQEAIILAHNTGTRLPDGSYSYTDLRAKVEILQEAGFQSDEIRILFDKNICGTEYPSFKSLYEDPRFSFLSEYRDILGDITEDDIIGEGMNAITLKSPTDESQLIKIAKPGNTDKLDVEFKNHTAFRNFLIAERTKAVGPLKEFLESIDIPEAHGYEGKKGIFQMDKVDGHNFRVLKTLELQPDLMIKIFPEGIEGVPDYTIEKAIKENGGYIYPKGSTEYEAMQMDPDSWEFIVNLESLGTKLEWGDFKKIVDFFKANGYHHNDSHFGNFMLGRDGKIYLIDFGRSRIPPVDITK